MEQKEMDQIMGKAEVLIEALPYIQKYNRKVIVVKYGGSAMNDEKLQKSVIQDVTLLKLVGFKPIIVHGGGKEISRWVDKVGKEPKFVNGLRVTDGETMEIAEMVLNKVNKDLVRMVEELGVRAVGISGKDGGLLQCVKKCPDGEDIGFVGDVVSVNPKVLSDLLEKDFLPIVAPIGLGRLDESDGSGNTAASDGLDEKFITYNINADDAACAIAKEMKADKLVFLTDTDGLYEDIENKSGFISRLTVSRANALIDSGCIGGGMLPKLSNCTDAIRKGTDRQDENSKGVNRVHILNGCTPHCLLLEIFTDKGIGTAIIADEDREEGPLHNRTDAP